MTTRLLVGTSYITVACPSAKRYFDLDGVRTEFSQATIDSDGYSRNTEKFAKRGRPLDQPHVHGERYGVKTNAMTHAGAPPLDWWDDGWDAVRSRLIDMMCPLKVCVTCGRPSERIVGEAEYVDSATRRTGVLAMRGGSRKGEGVNQWKAEQANASVIRSAPTLGWSDCGHNNWRPGVAFDPFTEDGDPMSTRLLVGDVRARIAEIPVGTVDLVVTSPPFLALRKYGDNDAEMGSEGTPADFLDALLDLTLEFRRVLAPHGSIAIELGDTYSGSTSLGGAPMDGNGSHRATRGDYVDNRSNPAGWPPAKSLALIPQLYPASLAYGRNLLRPDHTFAPWRVRNVITWCRPNPPVGALGDKVRPATSYITVACPSGKRYFDLDGVREPHKPHGGDVTRNSKSGENGYSGFGRDCTERIENPAGAPPLDWWDDALNPDDPTDHMTIVMPTQPYPGAHYATWPAKLAQRLIDMMCPRQVCVTCERPSERIVGDAEYIGGLGAGTKRGRPAAGGVWQSGSADGLGASSSKTREASSIPLIRQAPTLGWSDCGHNDWRPGHVFDPFAGSGTTLAVASGMGRDVTGIELYPENAWLIRDRVGMFLEVDGDTEPPKETPLDVLRDHLANQDDL